MINSVLEKNINLKGHFYICCVPKYCMNVEVVCRYLVLTNVSGQEDLKANHLEVFNNFCKRALAFGKNYLMLYFIS